MEIYEGVKEAKITALKEIVEAVKLMIKEALNENFIKA